MPGRRELAIALHETAAGLAQDAARRTLGKKSLFFCQSRALTEDVAQKMRGQGTEVFVHHGSVSKEERLAAEERFHHGTDACIVCTSTLELGIDVGDLDLVFQAEAPATVSSFLQRMGRTGRRAGQTANTCFLCEEPASVLQAAALVELAREGFVESVPVMTRCWPVLVQQLLAMTLQFGAGSPEKCWEQISVVPDFSGIARDEFDRVLEHMKKEDYLFESGGLLSMGQKAEKAFGEKNFIELYAVFSGPVLYRVQTATRRELGSLDQAFVDRLAEEMSAFLLAGRPWLVESVNHEERTVRMRVAPAGAKPKWGGYLPQFLGFEVCQRMKLLLTEIIALPYLEPTAAKALQASRDDMGALLRRPLALQTDDDAAALWWTFAGGRINQTLKHAMEWSQGWKVSSDNFRLRITGPGVFDEGSCRKCR